MPCIVAGDGDFAKIQKYIIKSIFAELVASGKEVLTVTRNERTFTTLLLKKEGRRSGLIHLMMGKDASEEVDYTVVRECLVPLLMKYEGSMDCEECHIQVHIPQV